MKIRLFVLASVSTLALLTGCSNEAAMRGSDESARSSSPSSENAPDGTEAPSAGDDEVRFQSTYSALGDLFAELDARGGDADPTNADEANDAAGLDESTNLIFADFTVSDDGKDGSFCLEADNDTYVSLTVEGSNADVALGDGPCAADMQDAAVQGDLEKDRWIKGADLMGDLSPSDPMSGAGQASEAQPSDADADAAQ